VVACWVLVKMILTSFRAQLMALAYNNVNIKQNLKKKGCQMKVNIRGWVKLDFFKSFISDLFGQLVYFDFHFRCFCFYDPSILT